MAETVVSAPATYKQPSRKGKKAWRKNVDLSDVQQGLEDVREEIIKGGVIAEKDSNDLFATDLTGDDGVARQLKNKRQLRVDEILAQRSAVAGLDGRKRKAKEEPSLLPAKKQKNGVYVPHRELRRLRAIADNPNYVVPVSEQTAGHDPWAESTKTKDPRLDFLEEAPPVKEPATLKEAPKSLLVNGKRIPNVRKPDAGKSYNPLVNDWSALLEKEGALAVEAEQKRLAAEAEAAEKEERLANEAAKVEAAERADYGTDYDSTWESEWEGFQSENEEVFTQKLRPRKTQAERNKVRTRKEREAKEKMETRNKERAAQEKRIRQIAREVSAKDKARAAHAMRLQRVDQDDSSASDDGQEAQLRRRRFGKMPLPEAALEVVLPDELEDSLRRLKPEGNLMLERYRNVLINGRMEMRRRQWQPKQPKRTLTEKWSYKDWRLK